MTELRLAGEIALRTLAVVAAAEIAHRFLLSDGRHLRRLWIGACAAVAAIALMTVADLKPRLPATVIAPSMPRLAATTATAAAQPWARPRYRRAPRTQLFIRGVYGAGAGAGALLLGASIVALRRIRRNAHPAPARAIAIARDLGTRGFIAIGDVDTPCTIGVIAPSILLPVESERWPDAKLRAAIAHELAHVRQRDALWLTLASMLCAALWFVPAAWLVRRRLRAAAEFASDAAAARTVGGGRGYARMLVEIAEAAVERRLRVAPAMAGGASIEERVERLIAPQPAHAFTRVAAALLLPLMLCAFDWKAPLASVSEARPLLAGLQSTDANIRAAALYRLARWQGREREVLPLLLAHLGDEAPVTALPRWTFARDGWAPARSTLVHASPGEVAAIGLASLSAVAAGPLAESLADPSPVVRRNAAWALGELRHPRGVGRRERAALIRALRDRDASVRAAAAWSLGDIGEPEDADAVRAMLAHETSASVRVEATASLHALERGLSLEAFRNQ